MSPLYYKAGLSDLMEFKNISPKVREYTPRYPSNTNSSKMRADYLVYDQELKRILPEFAFLFEKGSSEIPSNFNLVFSSPEVVVFEIMWE